MVVDSSRQQTNASTKPYGLKTMVLFSKKLFSKIKSFHNAVEATTTVEYAIMLAVLMLLSLKTVQVLGFSVADFFQHSADQMQNPGS